MIFTFLKKRRETPVLGSDMKCSFSKHGAIQECFYPSTWVHTLKYISPERTEKLIFMFPSGGTDQKIHSLFLVRYLSPKVDWTLRVIANSGKDREFVNHRTADGDSFLTLKQYFSNTGAGVVNLSLTAFDCDCRNKTIAKWRIWYFSRFHLCKSGKIYHF